MQCGSKVTFAQDVEKDILWMLLECRNDKKTLYIRSNRPFTVLYCLRPSWRFYKVL